MEANQVAYCIRIAQAKQSAREWTHLPADFQEAAVRWVYEEVKRHFDKRDIPHRIAASRARNFHDLMLAIKASEK